MNVAPQNLRDLESIKQFAALTEQFCDLLENYANFSPYEFMRRVAVTLTRLYGAAVELPEVECWDNAEVYTYASNNEVSSEIISRHEDRLGVFDTYWLVFNPYDKDSQSEKPITFSISGDLDEIYRDLFVWLVEYRKGSDESICNAVWYWQFGYENHWGYHAVHALGAIHWLITSDVVGFRPSQISNVDTK